MSLRSLGVSTSNHLLVSIAKMFLLSTFCNSIFFDVNESIMVSTISFLEMSKAGINGFVPSTLESESFNQNLRYNAKILVKLLQTKRYIF
ncbi:hypothetical protein [Francisella sp. TX07-6608]|uniref:hypothetical protein n=1 Tax=Francisella sp. TX07-6608 TaxID=573568 RepID=UPI0009242A44|nr:hypothetical protein [Francisella sp. TX07-6608]OIN84167.1 hypothetical protein KX00_1390 [Francisella sp. TX07-6608]